MGVITGQLPFSEVVSAILATTNPGNVSQVLSLLVWNNKIAAVSYLIDCLQWLHRVGEPGVGFEDPGLLMHPRGQAFVHLLPHVLSFALNTSFVTCNVLGGREFVGLS